VADNVDAILALIYYQPNIRYGKSRIYFGKARINGEPILFQYDATLGSFLFAPELEKAAVERAKRVIPKLLTRRALKDATLMSEPGVSLRNKTVLPPSTSGVNGEKGR
jgi:hypothetical protein